MSLTRILNSPLFYSTSFFLNLPVLNCLIYYIYNFNRRLSQLNNEKSFLLLMFVWFNKIRILHMIKRRKPYNIYLFFTHI